MRLPIIMLVCANAGASTIQSASVSLSDVSAAVASASNGDTVRIPAGYAAWTNSLTVTNGIQIVGAGMDSTIITNGITPGHNAYVFIYSPSSPSVGLFRLSGVRVDGNWNGGGFWAVNNPGTTNGIVRLLRVDRCKFLNCGNTTYTMRALNITALTFGVADNNVFQNNQKTFDMEDGVSDESVPWSLPASYSLGTTNTFVFESNAVTNNDSRCALITSGGQGGRYVFRHSIVDTTGLSDNQHFDMHGDFDGGNRGTVCAEIYGVIVRTKSSSYQFLDQRGGTALVFSNAVVHPTTGLGFQLREESTGTYPLQDQVADSYYWSNTYGPTTGLENSATPQVLSGSSTNYIQLGRDYWTNAKPGFSPLPFPHPLAAAIDGIRASAGSMTVGTLIIAP